MCCWLYWADWSLSESIKKAHKLSVIRTEIYPNCNAQKEQHQCSHENQQQCYAGGSGFATNQEYLVLTVKLRMCCIEFLPSLAGTCRIIFTPYTANGGVYCSFICRSTATPVIQIMIVRIKIDKPELLNIINHSTMISSHLHCTKRNYCHSCNQMSILDVNPNWKAAEQYKCDT
jgi:hypothetical protein